MIFGDRPARIQAWFRALFLLVVLLAVAGCGGDDSSAYVATGTANPVPSGPGSLTFAFVKAQSPTVVPQDTNQIRFRFFASDDANGTALLTEIRPFAASITLDGIPSSARSVKVTALGPNTVPLAEGVAMVTVLPGRNSPVDLGGLTAVTLVALTLSPPSTTVDEGETVTFQASATYSNGDILPALGATWQSDDETVATVDPSSGVANGVSRGTAVITATLNGVTGDATLAVSVIPVLTTLTVVPNNTTISEQATQQFTVVGRDQFGDPIEVSAVVWSASGDATIDPVTGLATAATTNNAAGTATITATVGALSDSTTLNVLGVPGTLDAVTTSPDPLQLSFGGPTASLISTGAFSNGPDRALTNAGDGLQYGSADPNVATVDNDGVVSPVAVGSTTITATAEGVTGNTIEVSVVTSSNANPVISLSGDQADIPYGGGAISPFATSTVTDDQAYLTGGTLTFDVTGGTEDVVITVDSGLPGVASVTTNGSSLVVVNLDSSASQLAVRDIVRATTVAATASSASGTRTVTATLTDGLGGTDSDSLSLDGPPAGRLYVGNFNNGTVVGFGGALTLSGTPTADTQITGLAGPEGLAIDEARDRMYVACNGDSTLRVIDNASTANGAAAGLVSATITGFNVATTVYYDSTNDRVYVGDFGNLRVWDEASSLTDTTVASADRVISGYGGFQVAGIAVDETADRLYTVATSSSRIDVFDNASTTSGTRDTVVDRTVTGGNTGLSGTAPWALALDPGRQLLYASLGSGAPGVLVFENPGTMTGDQAPARKLTGFPTALFPSVLVDPYRDILYISNGLSGSNKEVRAFNGASTVDGAVAVARTIAGFDGPIGFCVDFTRN